MKIIISCLIISLFFSPGIAFVKQDNPATNPSPVLTAEEIYKNTLNAYRNIESYTYINHQGEYDWFQKEAMNRVENNYGSLINKYKNGYSDYIKDHNSSSNDNNNRDYSIESSQFKKGIYGYKFLKPFIIQMVLIYLTLQNVQAGIM